MTDIVVGAGGRVEDKNFDSTLLAAGFAARRSGTVYSEWRDESGGANAKQWRLAAAAGSLVISTVDDANATASDAYVMTRSGNAVTKHEFKVSGTAVLTVDSSGFNGVIGGTTPAAITGTVITADTEFRGTVLTSNSTTALSLKTSGGEQLRVANAASAVNYMGVYGNSTGNTPTEFADGADTNMNMFHTTKGTGRFSFFTGAAGVSVSGAAEQLRIAHTASAVEYLQATGAASGGTPTLSAQGSSSNISLALTPKGSGATNIGNNFIDYFSLAGSSVGNINLSASGTSTNIDMRLTPKGAGLVRFGAFTSDGAISATGSISIKAADGTEYKLLAVAA